jgi:hypothetical protein
MIKGIFDNPLEFIEVTQDNFKECKDILKNVKILLEIVFVMFIMSI